MVSDNKIFIKIKDKVVNEIESQYGKKRDDILNTLQTFEDNIEACDNTIKKDTRKFMEIKEECGNLFKQVLTEENGYELRYDHSKYVSNGTSGITGTELKKEIQYYNLYFDGKVILRDVLDLSNPDAIKLLDIINIEDIKKYITDSQVKLVNDISSLKVNLEYTIVEYEKYSAKLFKSKKIMAEFDARVADIEKKIEDKKQKIQALSASSKTLEQKIDELRNVTNIYYDLRKSIQIAQTERTKYQNRLEDFISEDKPEAVTVQRDMFYRDKINVMIDNSVLEKVITNNISEEDYIALRQDKGFMSDITFEVEPSYIENGKKVFDSKIGYVIEGMVHRKILDKLYENGDIKDDANTF